MNHPWPAVPLGEVLRISIDLEVVDPSATYNIAGIYSFGRGLFKRSPLSGSETTYKVFHRLHKNQLVISNLKAWEGAIARVKDDYEGWFLSPQFTTFQAVPELINIKFLEWYYKHSTFWEELKRISRGMGARRDSVHPKKFLSLSIHLPPIPEQQRIVAKIEALAARIEEARRAKRDIEKKAKEMMLSAFADIVKDAPLNKIGNVAPLIRRSAEIQKDREYPELGIRSFGKGTFHKPALDYLSVGTKRLFRIEPGDLVFSNVFAWEGAIAVAQKDDEGRFGSHRFITCVPGNGIVTSELLCFYLLSREGLQKIGEASPGGAGQPYPWAEKIS